MQNNRIKRLLWCQRFHQMIQNSLKIVSLYFQTKAAKKNCVDANLFTEHYFIDQINELGTRWGEADTCLLYYYFPVIEITATIVWIVFILISRREGEHRSFTYVLNASMCVYKKKFFILCVYFIIFCIILDWGVSGCTRENRNETKIFTFISFSLPMHPNDNNMY